MEEVLQLDKKTKLDKFHKHEALDRTWLFVDMIASFLLEHPYIQQNKSLKRKVKKAFGLLYEVYQEIGLK